MYVPNVLLPWHDPRWQLQQANKRMREPTLCPSRRSDIWISKMLLRIYSAKIYVRCMAACRNKTMRRTRAWRARRRATTVQQLTWKEDHEWRASPSRCPS